ncbi:recombination-associated protein RdgC [Teredinibacter haidensis]|uniref:recombination-associated protein RdgC n=1 Tax=Teredinibacter haidensis TaxID=2731755 RepID=UPI0009491DB2|nr:recombination-associated protein RdgC [Teredinibacter haidensis]
MWFKNLRIFRLSKGFTISPEELSELMEPFAFQPCGKLDPAKYGWTTPLGRHGTELVHASNGNIMVCAKRQEKILPAAVVKEEMEDRIAAISAEEARHVGRKERDALKDEVIFSLLPKAFAKSSLDFAYIAPREKWIIANAASSKHAEEIASGLREAIGSLPAVPLSSHDTPVAAMTSWLRESSAPAPFTFGEECELQAPKDGRIIRCKNQDLTADEVLSHINSGMVVSKLALTWKDAVHFILDDQLAIKRVKFEDKLIEQANDHHTETAAEQFDADFAIMATELKHFIGDLLKALGGENTAND